MGVMTRIATALGFVMHRRSAPFEGASAGPRWSGLGWPAPTATAATAAGQPLATRAQHFARNNPWAAQAIEALTTSIVGSGIKPRPLHPDRAVREALVSAWERWCDESDAAGRLDFYGMQALACRGLIEQGEAFARLIVSDGAVRVALLDPEQVARDVTTAPGAPGVRIVGGIELDDLGRPLAYHVRPGGAAWAAPVRVPADDVMHLIRPLAPGQVRGVSWLAPALLRLHELDQYEDATLVRAKVAALFAGFVTDPNGDAAGLPGTMSGEVLETGMEPGSLLPLPPGADVKFSAPVEPVQYGAYVKAHLRAVAAAVGVPYEHVSGDYEGVTYSSVRAALVEFRRRVEAWQFHLMVRQFCRPVWRRFVTLASLAGTVPADGFARDPEPYLAAEWLPPRFDFVDPKKDIEAEVIAIDRGLKSRAMAVAERGYDIEEIDRQIAADRDRARELGLSFAPPGARRPANGDKDDE